MKLEIPNQTLDSTPDVKRTGIEIHPNGDITLSFTTKPGTRVELTMTDGEFSSMVKDVLHLRGQQ